MPRGPDPVSFGRSITSRRTFREGRSDHGLFFRAALTVTVMRLDTSGGSHGE